MKYTPEQIQQLTDELNQYTDNASKRKPIKRGSMIVPPNFPSIEEFIFQNSVCNSKYFYELEKKYESISRAVQRLRSLQASFAFQYGMNRQYSERMAIFVLQNITSWREKQEIENKTPTQIIIKRPERKKQADGI